MSGQNISPEGDAYKQRILAYLAGRHSATSDEVGRALELHHYQAKRLLELLVGENKVGTTFMGPAGPTRYSLPLGKKEVT
jgi:predicted ArsR family transcriptional regulator